ncbi:MAG: Nicotinate-nucleotide adenylyltransferase (EC [uncultured Sulfurovum sp.]|uniref:Probable nicotinate-nucleotide adenylyltransferase n=1 Tax=uncultured Sulfurovum sp. TaxID=269237 RepID=A0A6S6TQG1_9BACT|nr:MAG: Nicotinate-nucleotide adenylyltransferase (EC [uncultured Sulfurovum sp.]
MVNKNKPIVAIFGGSFDPPHLGHQEIVNTAIKNLPIDLLLVVPAYLNPFKSSSLASATQRLEWCHTLFDNVDKVKVNNYEISEGKSTPTSQSVKHFNIVYNVQYLIIGSDNLESLTKWHHFEWLNHNIIWVIISRNGHELETDELREYRVITLDIPTSSSHIRFSKDLHYIDNKIKQSVHNVLKGNQ